MNSTWWEYWIQLITTLWNKDYWFMASLLLWFYVNKNRWSELLSLRLSSSSPVEHKAATASLHPTQSCAACCTHPMYVLAHWAQPWQFDARRVFRFWLSRFPFARWSPKQCKLRDTNLIDSQYMVDPVIRFVCVWQKRQYSGSLFFYRVHYWISF